MRHETIQLGETIQLQVLEHGTIQGQSEGDLRLGVSVQSEGFAGRYDQVWIGRDDWRDFIGSLNAMERVRRGKASLVAMSPDEFELHLEIVDLAGHISVYGFLSRYHFRRSVPPLRSRIEYRTDVDPSLLRDLLTSFIAFGNVDV